MKKITVKIKIRHCTCPWWRVSMLLSLPSHLSTPPLTGVRSLLCLTPEDGQLGVPILIRMNHNVSELTQLLYWLSQNLPQICTALLIVSRKYIHKQMQYRFAMMFPFCQKTCPIWLDHRLRPIDNHLALYTMLYNNSAKNRYAVPVLNKTKQI